MRICDLCESEINCIDGVYICEEGHVLSHTQEVVEYTAQNTTNTQNIRSRTLQKKKTDFAKCKYQPLYKKLLLLYSVFKESMEFFGLKNDKIFHLIASLIKSEGKKVKNDYHLLKSEMFYVIVYFTKKHELEERNKILMINEYFEFMLEFPFYSVLKMKAEILGITNKEMQRLFKKQRIYFSNVLLLMHRLEDLKNEKLNNKQRLALNTIFNLNLIDLKTAFAYLKVILNDFEHTKDSRLTFYFRKFVYFVFTEDKIIIPDLCISIFLSEYFIFFNIKFDSKILLSNFLNRIYNSKTKFIYSKGDEMIDVSKEMFLQLKIKDYEAYDKLLDLIRIYFQISSQYYTNFIHQNMFNELNFS
ncbi:hypothetical protein H311_01056 [Anncaliia algerae PRA109]|nr:hypothetical protein H311_01056 [Anncaliia algerae PRA109]